MTQIDFYILAENSSRDINRMVCRLCEKALAQQMKVLIYTKSASLAQQLDDLLWTFKADSFIPHSNQLNEQPDAAEADRSFSYPVIITTETTAVGTATATQCPQLLINLSSDTPPFIQQFARIAEMVGKNADEKASARDRYRAYRQQGYSLNKYDL